MSGTVPEFSKESEQWVRNELETLENLVAQLHDGFPHAGGETGAHGRPGSLREDEMNVYEPLRLGTCHRCHEPVRSNQDYNFEGNSYFHRECGKKGAGK